MSQDRIVCEGRESGRNLAGSKMQPSIKGKGFLSFSIIRNLNCFDLWVKMKTSRKGRNPRVIFFRWMKSRWGIDPGSKRWTVFFQMLISSLSMALNYFQIFSFCQAWPWNSPRLLPKICPTERWRPSFRLLVRRASNVSRGWSVTWSRSRKNIGLSVTPFTWC